MVYMSTCALIMWGVGMPWLRRRHLQKLAKNGGKEKEEQGERLEEKEMGM